MYDEQHFTRDAADVRFDADAPGISVDEDGSEVQFDWDEVETVTIDDPPHAEAFDSKQFYKLPATVAKPIPQPYQYGEDSITWLKKPRDELKQAAWSLDNAPWTLGHPESGMVKNVDDVRGFWKNPRYIDSLDDLDADLHVPVGDEDAKEFIEANGDVSVGFYNRIARKEEYDGVVGGADDESVDVEGYQTDMLFDHCASVEVGRCPGEKGCGIDAQAHGHVDAVSFKGGTRTTDSSDETEGEPSSDEPSERLDRRKDRRSEPGSTDGTVSMHETTDQPQGIKEVGDDWFAIGPGEHMKESTDHPDDHMYPVSGCGDVADAWRLRSHGEDLDIDQDTLEERIIRAAEAQDCTDVPDTLQDAMTDETEDTTDCGCDGGTDTDDTDSTMEIEFDDLSTEAALAKVEAQHDGVAEHLDELRAAQDKASEAEAAAEELDLDDASDLSDSVAVLVDERDSLREELDEARRPQMEEDAEFIAERTDRFGDSAEDVLENLDEDPETVADKRELVEDLTEGYDEATANPGDDGGSTDTSASDGKYVNTPWE